jgi:hypothetical protein
VEAHAADGQTSRPKGRNGERDRERERRPRPVARLWYLLLLLPFVGLLWIPFYAKDAPELFGLPFFYWYQFAWVPVTAVLTWFVYRRVR